MTDSEMSPLFYSYAALAAVGTQALASGEVDQLWGAGLVVRRKLLVELYDTPGFPILIGRRGSALTCGEDLEICLGVCLLGYRLWYDERLTLRHTRPFASACAPSRRRPPGSRCSCIVATPGSLACSPVSA